MCIAIYKPEGCHLLPEILQNCWTRNPDGAGFMYAEDNKLHVVKGLMTYEAFREAYDPHQDKQTVLHFRIRTHGANNAENTHPFLISPTLGMVHNGIIQNVKCDIDPSMNDTWHFTKKHLTPLKNLWKNPAIKELIEEYIGHSKLILMNNKGHVEIFNSKLGTTEIIPNTQKEEQKIWFSNTSYKSPSISPPKKYEKKTPLYDNTPQKHFDTRNTGLWAGDTCYLLEDTLVSNPTVFGEVLPKGHACIVSWFGQGATCCVQSITTSQRAMLPIFKLLSVNPEITSPTTYDKETSFQAGEEAIFCKNYNHFRIGDIVSITRVIEDFIICTKDKSTTTFYGIPKKNLAPLTTIL